MADDSPPIFVFEDTRAPGLASWQITCFTINVIMGSGFLGVPSGFLRSGLILGPAILVVVSLMQWIAACHLAKIASRANALLVEKNASATLTPTLTPFAQLQDPLLKKLNGHGPATVQERPPSLQVPSHTSYEIMMLTRLLLGRWAERISMVSAALYMVGCLWSFISVFASSLAATIPLPWLQAGDPCDIYKTDVYGGGCITLYYFWVLFLAMLMAILLALDLREQAAFQCAMTAARAAIIVAMVGTLLWGSRTDFGLDAGLGASEVGADGNFTAAAPTPEIYKDPKALGLVKWTGLSRMVPIGVFCQLFQIGVPSLLQPLQRKRDFAKIFGTALFCTFVMYTSLGLAATSILRDDVDPSCNLNWQAYSPSSALALAVSLFPALDCCSVLPLNTVFLSNNVMASVFQLRWHAGEISRQTKYLCRLLCCLPPFACAFAFPSLAKALDFTGIVGIILPFIVTPLLDRASLAQCHARWGQRVFDQAEERAGYRVGVLSSSLVVGGLGVLGVVVLVYCVVCGLFYGF